MGMEREESLTSVEAARLIEWLTAHGHTAEEANACIIYMAYGDKMAK